MSVLNLLDIPNRLKQARGLLGDNIAMIPGIGGVDAVNRIVQGVRGGDYTAAAEAAADIVPAGRIATGLIGKATKGASTGLLGDVMNIAKPKYQGQHSAPDSDYGAPLNDISRDMYPADVYSAKGLQYYGSNSPGERQSLDVARKVRGNPDAEVEVFRAVPRGAQSDINAGDWITPSREYAQYHGDNVIKGQQGVDYDIISKKVPAKHVWTDANSLAEYGYDPTGLGIQGSNLQGTDSNQMNRFETDADRRMAVAQKNAVEMLGLPADNTPMDRAKAMGFDVDNVWYHGSPDEVSAFSKDRIKSRFPQSFGFHFANTEDEARNYSGMYRDPKSYMISAGNQLGVDIPEGGQFSTASMKADLDRAEIINSLVNAKRSDRPYDSVQITKQNPDYWKDKAGVNKNAIVFDPSRIRSPQAAFDPARSNEADLLALLGKGANINLGNINPLLGLLNEDNR